MSTMRLHGPRTSNYCNKIRLVLLEKGIEFEDESSTVPSQNVAFLERSPVGKVPFLEVSGTVLTESRVISEYLEEAYPEKALLPSDPLARAKVRELVEYIELHLELEARRLYPVAFMGQEISGDTKANARESLAKGARGLARLVKFSPYIAGSELTLADCAAFVHLPIVSMTTKAVFGGDILEPIPGLKEYLRALGDRPCFQTVTRQRKEAAAAARS